jgi:hypothetical protein
MGLPTKSVLATAAVAIAALVSTAGPAGAAAATPYSSYLVKRGDIPQINPATLAIGRVTRPALRAVYGERVGHWIRTHGFAGGAAEDPQFQEPGVKAPYSGQVEASVAAFHHHAGAAGAEARYLAYNRAVSASRQRTPLLIPRVPSARIIVVYGTHTGGTATHPAAAVAIWTEGRCMLSVSVGGYTAKARESYTRYAERVLDRVERRTHGRCSARPWLYRGGLF